jgi:hypothetical protein
VQSGLIVLASNESRVEIDSTRGGCVRSVQTGRPPSEWIYFDAARRPATLPREVVYDDVWAGGFEELFPNDAPGLFDGNTLPDHGELWNAPFEVVSQEAKSVHLRYSCVTVPALVEKTLRLDDSAARVILRYRIDNIGKTHLRYLFKLHAAMRVEAGDRILLPGGTVTAVDPSFSRILAGAEAYRWPIVGGLAGSPSDLSIVRSRKSSLQEFVYVSDLPAGWCGILRARTGERLRFQYPLEVFPYCWLFITYGGWRGHYTVVLEPCTNMPKGLSAACAAGCCATLEAGESREFDVRLSVEGTNGG